jgi:hypothetical protein
MKRVNELPEAKPLVTPGERLLEPEALETTLLVTERRHRARRAVEARGGRRRQLGGDVRRCREGNRSDHDALLTRARRTGTRMRRAGPPASAWPSREKISA